MVVKPRLKGCNRFCVYHVCWEVIPVIEHSYTVLLAPDITLGLLFVDFKAAASGDLRCKVFKNTAGFILSNPLKMV